MEGLNNSASLYVNDDIYRGFEYFLSELDITGHTDVAHGPVYQLFLGTHEKTWDLASGKSDHGTMATYHN